jgi:hypothetical protein
MNKYSTVQYYSGIIVWWLLELVIHVLRSTVHNMA